jgi:hypothetical protein
MVLVLAANIALATIVFAGVIALIMRAVRNPGTETKAVPASLRAARVPHASSRQHRAGALKSARPWA